MGDSDRIIPNLFIVGAPKCGTTAMHTYLGQHPEIFMSKEKENNHFATDLLSGNDPFRSDARYFAMFEGADDAKIIGESSVFYLFSKVAAANIYHYNPEAKIIIMLRNPVEMLQSYHAQLIYNQDEDILDFKAALKAEGKRKSGELKIKEGLRFKERLFYSEIVSYTEQVKRYLSLFGKEHVRIIVFEEFKKEPAVVYRKTLEFLNVDTTYQINFPVINGRKKFNPNHSNPQKGIFRSINKFPLPVCHFIKGLVSFRQPDSSMNPRTRKWLQKKYRPEIEQLSVLLGNDLNYWHRGNRN